MGNTGLRVFRREFRPRSERGMARLDDTTAGRRKARGEELMTALANGVSGLRREMLTAALFPGSLDI